MSEVDTSDLMLERASQIARIRSLHVHRFGFWEEVMGGAGRLTSFSVSSKQQTKKNTTPVGTLPFQGKHPRDHKHVYSTFWDPETFFSPLFGNHADTVRTSMPKFIVGISHC